jgi:hypothetical protein
MSAQPRQPNPQLQQAQQMFMSLSRGRQIIIVAAVVGLIFSFFPWYGYFGAHTANGWTDWGLLALLGFVVAGAIIVLPLLGMTLRGLIPSLPPTATDARVVMGAGAVSTIAVIIFMLSMGVDTHGLSLGSQGPAFASFVALICSLAIIAGGYLMQQEPAA